MLRKTKDVDGRDKPGHGDDGVDHSTLAPLALIGAAHFSISPLTKPPRYSGVARSSDTITAPRFASRSLTAGVCIASSAASCSFLTISAGAFLGRKIAFQV